MKNKISRLAALFLVVATMIPTLLMPVSAATTPRPSTNFCCAYCTLRVVSLCAYFTQTTNFMSKVS